MRANELRIGNKINTEYGICTIQEIDIVNVEVYSGDFPDEGCKVWKHDEITSILLTEEWLIKCGFKLISDTIGDYQPIKSFELGYIELTYGVTNDKDAFCTTIGDIDISPIKYVHQLQNLHFALTGNELIL